METQTEQAGLRVLVTGATGFVGRAVVRELAQRGHVPVCLARQPRRMEAILARMALGATPVPVSVGAGGPPLPQEAAPRADVLPGDLFDTAGLERAAQRARAAIHLVGIIAEDRWRGQTFERIHVEGTQRVVDACRAAGIRRLVHVSALGTRPNAVSEYHRTKWEAEERVRGSGLDWTIFRPSVIHGPDAEFMHLMHKLACDLLPPMMPHFGNGLARLQPVSVDDVAYCLAAALTMPETIGQVYELGGPSAMTWRELYRTCRDLMPGAKAWKPVIGQPVPMAKLMAMTVMQLPIIPRSMRFSVDAVQMSQEDAVCDPGLVERTFGIKLRDFREELARYASQIT